MGYTITCNVASNVIWITSILSTLIFHIECFRTEELKCDRKLCNNGDCYIKTNSITVGREVEGYFMDCPYEYDRHNGRCWAVVMEKKSWQNAYIYPDTGWIHGLFSKGESELAAGYIQKKLQGNNSWVWTRALIHSNNNSWVSWNKPRYSNGTIPRFTLHSNYSCIALGPTNYTYWEKFDCGTELYSLHEIDPIVPPQIRNYMCRCHPRYSGESCDTIDSELRTPELTNPSALQCHGNTVIFIEFALYGYKANDSTGTDCAAPNTLAVLRYLYDTQVPNQGCQGKDNCKVQPLILGTHIGQVCTNRNATLVVRYSCVNASDMSCHSTTSAIEHEKSKTCMLRIAADMSWNKSMDYCLIEGGVFAAFNGTIPYQPYEGNKPVQSFWIFDQLSDIRPDTRPPVQCTMATVVNQTKPPVPPVIHVVTDCSKRLPGICAIPPYYQARPNMATTMRSTSNTWYLPENTTTANASYNIADAMVDTTTDARANTTTDSMVDNTTDTMVDTTTDTMFDTTTDTMMDTTIDAMMEPTTDAMVDTTTDAMSNTTTDSMVDNTTDTMVDTTTDTMFDTTTDTMMDTTIDAMREPTTDAMVDTTIDAMMEPTTDTMVDTTAEKPQITSYSIPQSPTLPPPNNCSARNHSGITWPETIHGVTVIKPCPAGQNGHVIWNCGYNGEFNTKGPDYSNCTTALSTDLAALSKKLVMGTQPDVVVTELATVLEAAQTMASGDIINSINLLEKTILAQKETLQNITNEVERQIIMNTFTFGIVNTSGVLLGSQHLTTWYGLTETNRAKAAAKLISDVDSTAILYASAQTKRTKALFQYNTTIQVYVETRDPADNSKLELPNIIVPSEAITTAIADHQYSMFLPIIASTYNTIGQILPIGDHFHKFTNVSQIIGASLNQTIQLQRDKVTVNIEKPNDASLLNESVCVFWNELDSRWSTDGCELGDETNDTHFVCKCNHMTSFAVLMSFNPKQVNIMTLNIITIIGCSISIVCLAACIVTFFLVRLLRNLYYKVHLHLCISLMIADIILITAHFYKKDYVEADMYCTVLAMLLHYFYLATFMWMCLEGVQIYLALVRVFAQRNQRMYVYFIVGYGIPGVVVGISAAVNVQGYASTADCFLDTKRGFIWGFIAFVLVILIFNTVLLFLALRSAARLKNTPSTKHANSAKKWLWQLIILHPLLGLTWVFGFLQFGDQMVFSYVFTILNSLQGMFIFLFHVFRNNKVRHNFIKKCPCCDADNVESPRAPRAELSSSSGHTENYERQHFATIQRPQLKMNNAMQRMQTDKMEAVNNGFINLDENQLQPYLIPRARLRENVRSYQRGDSIL